MYTIFANTFYLKYMAQKAYKILNDKPQIRVHILY